MKLLILSQSASKSTSNLVHEFAANLHSVQVIHYAPNKIQRWHKVSDSPIIKSDAGTEIDVRDYDAVILRSWGTASIGAGLLRHCEENGVVSLNETRLTGVMNSKCRSTKLFQSAAVQFPRTYVFEKGFAIGKEISNLLRQQVGGLPYVLKFDYGTGGASIRFIDCLKELKIVLSSEEASDGCVVQEFLGDIEKPICHFRILYVDGQVFEKAILLTAKEPRRPSNLCKGAAKELVPITADAVKAVEQAVSLSKLTYAGVDAMEVDGKYYVLEVNDSPDLEMFDSEGVNASSACRVAMEQKLRKVKNEF